ncbi:hypothetical protein RB195_002550 [Necator americanus]|uniref:Uncharacterized protein n=1 Tax=Necator americanus TaxID=51031 RepID=A0ABR1DME8_NECAM
MMKLHSWHSRKLINSFLADFIVKQGGCSVGRPMAVQSAVLSNVRSAPISRLTPIVSPSTRALRYADYSDVSMSRSDDDDVARFPLLLRIPLLSREIPAESSLVSRAFTVVACLVQECAVSRPVIGSAPKTR